MDDPETSESFDPRFEFNAPKYHDFTQAEDDQDEKAGDIWFLTKTAPDDISPQVARKQSVAVALMQEPNKPLTRSAKKKAEKVLASQARGEHSPSLMAASPSVGDEDAARSSAAMHSAARAQGTMTRSSSKAGKQGWASAEQGGTEPSPMESSGVLPSKRLYTELCSTEKALKLRQPTKANPPTTRFSPAAGCEKDMGMAEATDQAERAKKRRRMETDRLREMLASKGPILPPRSVTALTIPCDIHLHTEERAQQRHPEEAMELRSGKFVSLAEQVEKFQTKTPQRFHTLSQLENHPTVEEPEYRPLTQPKSPCLLVTQRARPIRVKSSVEIEEEEMANMPKFKARPFSNKIRQSSGELGVPKVAPAPVTQPQPTHFQTDERAKLRPSPAQEDCTRQTRASTRHAVSTGPSGLTFPKPPQLETAARSRPTTLKSTDDMEAEELANVPKFKARPLSKRVMESCGDLGVPRIAPAPVTIPEGFNLVTDSRLGTHPSAIPTAQPYKHAGSGAATQRPEHHSRAHITVAQPFQLHTEERGALKQTMFIERVLDEEERAHASRYPIAQPLPYTTDFPQRLKKPQVKEPTELEPFDLESVWRHEMEVAQAERERQRKEKEERQAHLFKAQPIKVTAPFAPTRSRVPLTEVKEPQLLVEKRAKERSEFDKKMEEKERLAALYREEYAAVTKAIEQEQVKQMRKEMVHHARPMPTFANPFVPQKSNKELTRAQAPPLKSRGRKERGVSVMR